MGYLRHYGRDEVCVMDPYQTQLDRLDQLIEAVADLQITAAAEVLRRGLADWDKATLGDWRDAVAVRARRSRVHAREGYACLARLVTCDGQRAYELAGLLRNYGRDLEQPLADLVKDAGGLKQAVLRTNRPVPPINFSRRSKSRS